MVWLIWCSKIPSKTWTTMEKMSSEVYHCVGMESIDMENCRAMFFFLERSIVTKMKMLWRLSLGRSFSGQKLGMSWKRCVSTNPKNPRPVLKIDPPYLFHPEKRCRVGRFYEENLLLEMFEHWRRAALDSYGATEIPPCWIGKYIENEGSFMAMFIHYKGWSVLKVFHCVVKVS